jgi:hypothetical protein
MTLPSTRGEIIASTIKAHPEMTEQEIAARIDVQINAATNEAEQTDYEYLRDVIIAVLDSPDEDIAEVEILANAIRDMHAKLLELQESCLYWRNEVSRLKRDIIS